MNKTSVDEILDFAISSEVSAARFYTELPGRMESDAMRTVFEGFAEEERGHKIKLEAIKQGKVALSTEKVVDLKIADYVVDVEPKPNMDYQDALIWAMKSEKLAFRLYSNLAELTEDEGVRNTLLALAQEEAKHKLRFELEYDDVVLKEA